MKKIIAFEILFAKKLPVFFSGRSVDGIVVVHTSQDINIRCIKIRIHGEANTFIRMRSSSPFVNQGHGRIMMQTGSAYHYTENEVYLDRSIMLWGTNERLANGNSNDTILPAGRHELEFNFSLSADTKIPSSFCIPNQCSIHYEVIATISRSGKSPRKVKRPFVLLESIDVNKPALMQPPCPLENETVLCCCCCQSGPIKFRVSLGRSGYCPGEKIDIDAECQNLTSRRLARIRVFLTRHVQWKAKGVHCCKSFVCYETQSNKVIQPQETFRWNDQLTPLPSIPPTIKSCRFISVSYQLQASVDIPFDENLQVAFPVIIGTIPARPIDPCRSAQETDDNSIPVPSSSTAETDNGCYLALPPPSYEDCVTSSINLSHLDASITVEDDSSSLQTEAVL